jgi:hypothetical protein
LHHGLRSLLHLLHARRHFVVSIEILAPGHFGDVTMAISPLVWDYSANSLSDRVDSGVPTARVVGIAGTSS